MQEKKMKLLIVDDEIEICKRLQRELQKEGHEVEYITSPLDVLMELKKAKRDFKPYNILILNVRMPGMDGLALLRRIREEHLDVEVIITTGYRDEEVVIEAIHLSVGDYVNKPISLEELDAAISHVYNRLVKEKQGSGNYRILVVDDEKELCTRIKRELEKEGYQAASVYTAEECIEYFKKNKVDVLIADIKMPGMSGLEMLERCREIADDFVSIIITGHGNHETAKRALKLHAYDYLRKPLSIDALILSVKKSIEHLKVLRSGSALKEEEK
jgi:DNA-binding NtrC family response regulator